MIQFEFSRHSLQRICTCTHFNTVSVIYLFVKNLVINALDDFRCNFYLLVTISEHQ